MATMASRRISGIDLESVISASVAAKKTQLQQPITAKTNTQITLTGVVRQVCHFGVRYHVSQALNGGRF